MQNSPVVVDSTVTVKLNSINANGEELFKFDSTVVGWCNRKSISRQSAKVSKKQHRLVFLAGFPVVGVHATVYDGSYHEVDSSEMAFHIAGSMAFKEAMQKANPCITEPIMKVEVTMPEEYMGDVIGDINLHVVDVSKVWMILAAENRSRICTLAEMFGYSTRLTFQNTGTW